MFHDQTREQSLESTLALYMSLDGHRNENLNASESLENLKNNLVTVSGQSKEENGPELTVMSFDGTGLQLTTDGFVLTAYHNIAGYDDEWREYNRKVREGQKDPYEIWKKDIEPNFKIIDQNNKTYPVDPRIWAFDSDHDIALIKVITGEKPKSIDFKISERPLSVSQELDLCGIANGLLLEGSGEITGISYNNSTKYNSEGEILGLETKDLFCTDIISRSGMSGGIFLNPEDGGLYGTILSVVEGYHELGTGMRKTEIKGKASGVSINHARDLIRAVAYSLGKNF